MVKANGSWIFPQYSVQKSSNLSCMIAHFEPKQHEFLPVYTDPCLISANVGLNGYGISGLPDRGRVLDAHGLSGQSVPHLQSPFLTPNPFLNEKQFLLTSGLDGDAASSPQQKRFLIFDQSGVGTRLILSSLCSPAQNAIAAARKLTCKHKSPMEGLVVKPEHNCPEMPILNEELHENHMVAEGSDSHEDTEEINALLYSDDEDIDCDDDTYNGEDDDDDVVSTGRSPLAVEEDCRKQEQLRDDGTDEVASPGGSSKRWKALNGRNCKSPLKGAARLVRPHALYDEENGVDFNCSVGKEMSPIVGSKRLRKDKIHDSLRVLQSIIPGAKGKDPFLVLDEAISYLKFLKSEANAISVKDPETSSCYWLLN
ncbi:hypothetical protein Nepgr_019741 [Nepenthes gracilis]|uniref:BHLH domain-containing protein n=1 Tax=Nepenthes gracilis TaxID=150966 RepID=A0AAD3SU22_NEPGR|nr:hypothetical protein Nepgr_019741 [Nepenthes gracilis]